MQDSINDILSQIQIFNFDDKNSSVNFPEQKFLYNFWACRQYFYNLDIDNDELG